MTFFLPVKGIFLNVKLMWHQLSPTRAPSPNLALITDCLNQHFLIILQLRANYKIFQMLCPHLNLCDIFFPFIEFTP